jgi:precorrin-8X/cobalt-precorrin-8 methylmutase
MQPLEIESRSFAIIDAEAGRKLLDLDIPYITNVGRKGGSNVAAAVTNALILLAAEGC